MATDEHNVAKAEEFKVLANEAFKERKFAHAIDLYTQAIELNGQNAVYLANRAFAHLRLEEYGSAILDATKAIEVDPKYSKGYYRRGAAHLGLGKFKEALKDFQQVKKMCPNDPDATKKLKECEKAVMKLKFEEAISVPGSVKRPIAESIDFRSIDVEPQYSGARIEGDTITLDFVKKMMDDFKKQKCLHKRYAFQIVLQTKEMLQALPSLVDITVPHGKHFTVCGDVHGQFYDLLNIFELNGLPSEENPYLFNGDFVDRGSFSLEVILTLFAFKCMSPSAIYLARGNHESKSMNKIYGFEGEVRSKLNETFVELFAEVFCCLPLAHVINEKVFVVHGGLFSVDGVKLSEIRSINRFCEPPEEGLMCELLWSDPQPLPGRGPSKRGVGLSFGGDVTKRFLKDNNLDLVVRSHEVKDEGYEVDHDGKLITVFSAPNYCDQMGNKGAFIRFEAPDKTLIPLLLLLLLLLDLPILSQQPTMSKGPGLYSDIGKKARDLLYKDYNTDQKFTLTTYSPTGIALTASSTKKGELFLADINTQLKHKNVTTDIKVDTDSNLFTTITVTEPAPGLKTILSFRIPEPELKSGKAEVQYLHDYAGISASIGLTANPVANFSGVIGNNVVALGGDLSYDTKTGVFTRLNAGLNFTKDDLIASLTLNEKANALNASYYHVVNPVTKTAVGAEVSHRFSTKENTLTLGTQHAIDSLTTAKLRFNNFGLASGLIQHEWRPKSFFTISGEVDTKAIEKSARIGIALALKP